MTKWKGRTRKETIYYKIAYGFTMWTEKLVAKGWLSEKWEDRLDDLYEDRIRPVIAKILCRTWGHFVEMDHCGMSKHDYCVGCGKGVPGGADRHHVNEVHKYGTVCHEGQHYIVAELNGHQVRLVDENTRWADLGAAPGFWAQWIDCKAVPPQHIADDPLVPYVQPHVC